jgi:hypothetical protein
MEKGNNKNTWIWIVVAVLVVVAVIIAVKMKKADTTTAVQTPADTNAVQVTEDTTDGSVDAPATKGVTPVSISYQNALIKYKDYRIQLAPGATCAASPNSVTYKNGATIMIDNRGSTTRTLKIGSMYSVKGYGFKIIKLSAATLPAKLLVDCGAQQNVATILLQK